MREVSAHQDGGTAMDYGKSGNPKNVKAAPKHREHNQKGSKANPYGATPAKAELLARMKAAAEARASGRSDKGEA